MLTLAEGKPPANLAAEPLDFTHGGEDAVLIPRAFFVYTRRSPSGFLFFLDGGPISIGAKTQMLGAKSEAETEQPQSFSMHIKRTRHVDEYNWEIDIYEGRHIFVVFSFRYTLAVPLISFVSPSYEYGMNIGKPFGHMLIAE